LLGELLLCCFAFMPTVATGIGWSLYQLIRLLNYFITSIDQLPFVVWGNLSLSFIQVIFLYGVFAGLSYWLIQKSRIAFPFALICLLIFVSLRTSSFAEAIKQRKLIVYNVPRFRAIDFIEGRNYVFKGDSALTLDDFSQNFHLRPSRQLHRINQVDSMGPLMGNSHFFLYGATRIVIIDKDFRLNLFSQKIRADLVIISGNPKLDLNKLSAVIDCLQIVIDSSNSPWRADKWQTDCSKVGIPCYNVNASGAFVMNLP
jgi:competence protein ComEC